MFHAMKGSFSPGVKPPGPRAMSSHRTPERFAPISMPKLPQNRISAKLVGNGQILPLRNLLIIPVKI